MQRDKRIDDYITNAPEFAGVIMVHLRKIIREAIPDVTETIKWNSPHFLYNDEIVCSVMAFKNHVALTFWRGKELPDPENILGSVGKTRMGSIKNIKSIDDLPPDQVLKNYLEEAVKFIEE